MTEEVAGYLIRLNVTPEEVFESFPTDFLGEGGKPEQGFAEKILEVPGPEGTDIKFEMSYDGESELLAVIKDKPVDVSDNDARQYLLMFLDIGPEDDDEDEESDEDDD